MGIRSAAIILLVLQTWTLVVRTGSGQFAGEALKMYVNKLPKIPKIYGYRTTPGGVRLPANLTLGMYQKYWKFHRDLAAAPVFVYGTSAETATFPGPCIEALEGVPTYVTWENHLPRSHILPWDPTVPTAIPKKGGVPGVVHLHGGVHEPQSDGSALAWFTAGFQEKGPAWSKPTYTYPNVQHPGNLWYHDHTLGLTRASILAGLLGPYVIRNPRVEDAYGLPSGRNFDRHLVIADRSFNRDGSIYMNYTGNNPSVHPQWRPEYFGDAITVNGKAWPYLKVQRRRYRFRILNASNARYFRLALSNGMSFTVIGSDASYLSAPVTVSSVLVSTGEVFDVVVDFSMVSSTCQEIEMTNNAPYPHPSGTVPALPVTKVMKFLLQNKAHVFDKSRVPVRLADHFPRAMAAEAVKKRYIVMYEYLSSTGTPTRLLINGKRLRDPVTETPKSGSTELWELINLSPDDHPLHIHLGNLQAIKVQRLINATDFTDCMKRLNDAVKCDVDLHATGQIVMVPRHERTWKYVVKVEPFSVTTVIVKFNLIESNKPYPFDATAEPGFVYHCHILDHEDNEMIRPLKLVA